MHTQKQFVFSREVKGSLGFSWLSVAGLQCRCSLHGAAASQGHAENGNTLHRDIFVPWWSQVIRPEWEHTESSTVSPDDSLSCWNEITPHRGLVPSVT